MKFLTPIILIALSVGLFYFYLNPTYTHIQEVRGSLTEYNQALVRAKAASARRDELVNTYNSFSSTDIERLEKMLPDGINNIRLLVDMNALANQYSDGIHNIKITTSDDPSSGVAVSSTKDAYGALTLTFSTSMTYSDFQKFMQNVQKSLRIMDITAISFQPSETSLYGYNVTLKTYWLR